MLAGKQFWLGPARAVRRTAAPDYAAHCAGLLVSADGSDADHTFLHLPDLGVRLGNPGRFGVVELESGPDAIQV